MLTSLSVFFLISPVVYSALALFLAEFLPQIPQLILQNLFDKEVKSPGVNWIIRIDVDFGQVFILDHFVEEQMLGTFQANWPIKVKKRRKVFQVWKTDLLFMYTCMCFYKLQPIHACSRMYRYCRMWAYNTGVSDWCYLI